MDISLLMINSATIILGNQSETSFNPDPLNLFIQGENVNFQVMGSNSNFKSL